ncbi:MAG: hypothetical protein GC162_17720 [Planctomycetes bacterium]|nr:hypothetical protein [Planctomycetota bacterium]
MKFEARHIVGCTVIGGMVGGAIFRDPWSGPVFGAFIGLIMAVFFVGLVVVARRGQRGPWRRPLVPILIAVITFAVPFSVMKLMFDPPVWLLVRKVVASPVPASLSEVRKKIEYDGPNNVYMIRFHVAPADAAAIVKLHGMVRVEPNPTLLASYQQAAKSPPPWWNVGGLINPAVDRITIGDYQRVFLYDAANEQGYLLVFAVDQESLTK